MLDRLDQIAWSELSHAYGEADDVPELLRDLASPDDTVRHDALYALYGNIWHQGTVYEATAYAVPFLIELLTIPSVVGKSEILHLLQAIAGGSSYLDVHQHFDSYRSERETDEFQAERTQELDWVHAAHQAVVDGVPIYQMLLSDVEAEVRAMAAGVLTSCPERRLEIEPVLRLCIAGENDPVAKASLLFASAQFASESNRQDVLDDLVIHLQNQSEAPLVRFVAALGAILLGGEPLINETLRILRQTVTSCEDTISELPWELGDTPVAAASAVLAPYPKMRLDWLLEMLENQDPENRSAAIDELEEMCRERRAVSKAAVVALARLVADPDPRVRKQAASALPILGNARRESIPLLMALQNHPDGTVRILAEETLAKVTAERNKYALENWLRKPKEERTIAACIAILKNDDRSFICEDAATALELFGPPAREAVPALQRCLNAGSHWLRVRAARALWKITGNPTESLPILKEEMQCRPAGLLVLDCLGDMGRGAESALPALRQIVDSELRLVEIGSVPDWIDEDEAFCEAAQRAISRIESALSSKNQPEAGLV